MRSYLQSNSTTNIEASPEASNITIITNPALLAKKIRRKLKPKNNPRLIADIAQSLNIVICHVDSFNKEINAVCFKNKQHYIIGLNTRNSRGKNLFVIAHEIGHVLLHAKILSINLTKQHDLTNKKFSAMDIQANTFAAELLMPESVFRVKYPNMNIEELANHFDVHQEAVSFWSRQLEIG